MRHHNDHDLDFDLDVTDDQHDNNITDDYQHDNHDIDHNHDPLLF